MANIMNQKNVKNHASRGSFDLSRRVCFTSSCGELLPVSWLPVLPGDKFKIKIKPFMRTQPLQTATFARIREYYDVFFVPYSLLWDKFNSWIIQTDNPQHALNSTSTIVNSESHPYFLSSDLKTFLDTLENTRDDNPATYGVTGPLDDANRPMVFTSRKLMDYLGYTQALRNATTAVRVNPFPILAYQKIYQDYYRNPLWERSAPWTYNLDYILGNSETKISFPNNNASQMLSYKRNMWCLQYCNFDKDIFFGRYPNAQFGDESVVDLPFPEEDLALSVWIPSGAGSGSSSMVSDNGTVKTTTANSQGGIRTRFHGAYFTNDQNLNEKRESISTLSILQLRKAQQVQKLREITQTGSLDYRDQISKIWNESSPLALSYRCQYIGGTQSDINVSEVINQSIGGNSSAVIKGVGRSSADGTIRFVNKTNEYGLLMVIKHEKPLIDWANDSYIDKNIYTTTADMYPNPMFDRIGNEAIYSNEFFDPAVGLVNPVSTLGYAPRYYNYKTAVDRCLGAFNTSSLSPWVVRFDTTDLNLNSMFPQFGQAHAYQMFKVRPSVVSNIFSVRGTEVNGSTTYLGWISYDQFLNACYLDIKAIRKLDRDGLPY